MMTLAIDIETYSGVDLPEVGMYRYAEDPDFKILLFSYAFDNEAPVVIDLEQGEKLPEYVLRALSEPAVIKTAYNAAFEITCLCAAGLMDLRDIDQWQCSMVHGAMAGLPMGLEAASQVLGLGGKMKGGKILISYFCKPCNPTKANGMRTRNLPHHDPDKWRLFKEYCAQDVAAEVALRDAISWYTVPEKEWQLWALDQRINATGVAIDRCMVDGAMEIDAEKSAKLLAKARELTGLDNPNSLTQLRLWVEKQLGCRVESLAKDSLPEVEAKATPVVKEVLHIRRQLSKTSVSKYGAMVSAVCEDGRVKGMLQFYGASRTGRWAGRLVQLHNLPRNKMEDLDIAREIVSESDATLMDMMYRDTPGVLSQLIRTAFVPSPGKVFYIADFSAIEARVLSWLAGEKWRMDVFATHGKIYEASAAAMFQVPLEDVTKGSDLRQKGKVAELACGYGGGTGALKQMGAGHMPEDELERIITQWRYANPAIVEYWGTIEKAVKDVIKGNIKTGKASACSLYLRRGHLVVQLPSGRELVYRDATVEGNGWRESIAYMGSNQVTRKWEKIRTYGGKLTENIVQAIARDCLAKAMLRLAESGYNIVMHIHDEVVIEAARKSGRLETICSIMGRPIDWAPGLLLRADGFVAEYYKKD